MPQGVGPDGLGDPGLAGDPADDRGNHRDIDVFTKLGVALPIFLITVAALTFVLLTFAFLTILVPITSIIGFLLSAGPALGAQIAVFQWGWLKISSELTRSRRSASCPSS